METVEVVIRLPKKEYDRIKTSGDIVYDDWIIDVARAIAHGTVLPKDHGDLKDMGNLQYVFDLTREDFIYSGKDIERAIKSMKTIIKADREVDNG